MTLPKYYPSTVISGRRYPQRDTTSLYTVETPKPWLCLANLERDGFVFAEGLAEFVGYRP